MNISKLFLLKNLCKMISTTMLKQTLINQIDIKYVRYICIKYLSPYHCLNVTHTKALSM